MGAEIQGGDLRKISTTVLYREKSGIGSVKAVPEGERAL